MLDKVLWTAVFFLFFFTSNYHTTTVEVPQGSCLRSVLFIYSVAIFQILLLKIKLNLCCCYTNFLTLLAAYS